MFSYTLVQFPNKALWVALAAAAVNMFATGSLHQVVAAVFYIALTIWAYQEIVSGVNWFRRLLGATVLIYVFVTQVLRLAK